jgi:MoaA/NifB/PqqE/SkfB family radical SAM enzyme
MHLIEMITPEQAYYPQVPPLNIELNNRCNCHCPYCANPVLTRARGQMSDSILSRLEEEAAEKGYVVMGFHGTGEPLLRMDLEHILKRFRDRNLWMGSLTSNGVLLKKNRLSGLLDAGLTSVYISLDTLDADLYRRTRGGKLDLVLRNIRNAAEQAPDLKITVGLMNHKEQTVNDEVQARFEELLGGFPYVKMHVYECGNMPSAAENWSNFGDYRSETCAAPAHFLTILADGKVALCCADQDGKHILGDVATHSLEEIWFDRRNQESFRNIGLGVGTCPQVCMDCVLKAPSRSIDAIPKVLYGPYGELVAEARRLRDQHHLPEALKLYTHAYTRNPADSALRLEMADVEKAGGVLSDNYHLKYKESC